MYKDVLLAIDINEESSWRKALPTAVDTCMASGATLHIMTVVPDFGMPMVAQFFPADFEKKAMAQTEQDLKALIDKSDTKGISVRHLVANGTIYEEIISAANSVDADLIVLASHRPQLSDYLLGPNAARVVRHAGQSVLVVRE